MQGLTRPAGTLSETALTSATLLELPLSAQSWTPALRIAEGAGVALLGRGKDAQHCLGLGTNPRQRPSPGNPKA